VKEEECQEKPEHKHRMLEGSDEDWKEKR
jgi:DNA polymerase sigma